MFIDKNQNPLKTIDLKFDKLNKKIQKRKKTETDSLFKQCFI